MRLAFAFVLSLFTASAGWAEPQHLPAKGHAMVDAANPAAVDSGLKILKAGGSAIDAAVAVQATLGLV